MNHHSLVWLAPPDRHQQRIDSQIATHQWLHRPTNPLARKQNQHYRQVQPPLIGADVGDVCDPDFVRFADVELPLQAIWRSHRRLASKSRGTDDNRSASATPRPTSGEPRDAGHRIRLAHAVRRGSCGNRRPRRFPARHA